MTDTLTQDQIDTLKVLLQRYYRLDNEKSAIRVKIDQILKTYKDRLWEDHLEQVQAKDEESDDFRQCIYQDEFPYFLEDHLEELQEARENEWLYILFYNYFSLG